MLQNHLSRIYIYKDTILSLATDKKRQNEKKEKKKFDNAEFFIFFFRSWEIGRASEVP